MATDPRQQALALLLALIMGIGMGLLYDCFRPLRYRVGRIAAALLDLLFCLLCGAAAFVFAMGADNGRLGIWELSADLVGFLLYLHLLSPLCLPIFTYLAGLLFRIIKSYKKIWVKCAISIKWFFQNVRK